MTVLVYLHQRFDLHMPLPSVHEDVARGQEIVDHMWLSSAPDTLSGYGIPLFPSNYSTGSSLYTVDGRQTIHRISDMSNSHLRQVHRDLLVANPWNPVMKVLEDEIARRVEPSPILFTTDAGEVDVREVDVRDSPVPMAVDPLPDVAEDLLLPHSIRSVANLKRLLPLLVGSQLDDVLGLIASVVAPYSAAAADELRFPPKG